MADMAYVNLNVDNTDNFQEMFVRARSVDEGIYRKILLRVSELDSPVVFRIWRFFCSTLCDKIIHNDDTK